MHSHILAWLLNLPAVALAYETKMTAFAGQHGIDPRFVLNVSGIQASQLSDAFDYAVNHETFTNHPNPHLTSAKMKVAADLSQAAHKLK
jgi:polysaccharide pyruvyl transferase WcaK-like protein